MSQEIYKQQIIDRYQSPRHKGEITSPSAEASVVNSLCGDQLQVQLLVENDQIRDVRWTGEGCAISLAAADLLADTLLDLRTDQALGLTKQDVFDLLGIELKPSREKCASSLISPGRVTTLSIEGNRLATKSPSAKSICTSLSNAIHS